MLKEDTDFEIKNFNIQERQETWLDLNNVSDKIVNKIIYTSNHLFIIMENELIIYNLYNMKKIGKIKSDDYKIYKVFSLYQNFYLINEKFIIKYDWKELKKLEEFEWIDQTVISKLKLYKNYLILRCFESILIIDLYSFKQLLNIKIINPELSGPSYFNSENEKYLYIYISMFKNYLVYRNQKNIIILNLDSNFVIEKEFIDNNLNFEKKLFIYKNYFITTSFNEKFLSIMDLDNNYNKIIVKDYDDGLYNIRLKIQGNLLGILSISKLYIYDMENIKLIININKRIYSFSNVIFSNNLLIFYNDNIKNLTVFDYKNEIFNLNIVGKKDKYFLKFYKNNLIYTENKIIKINEFKNNLNVFIEEDIKNLNYKNYIIYIEIDSISIYNIKDRNLIYKKKIEKTGYNLNYLLYNSYLIVYKENLLIILNLDNFEDIKEKEYEFILYEFYNYEDTLFILFKNKYIEALDIINFKGKIVESNTDLISIKIYKNYLFSIKSNSIRVYDLKNDIKFIKNIDELIKDSIIIKDDIIIINIHHNKKFIDMNSNFEIIKINPEDLKKLNYIFNGLIIFYDNLTFHVYIKFKKNYILKKLNYANTTNISSCNNYLFIAENCKHTKVVIYENNNFNLLKILDTNSNKSFIFDELIYLIDSNILNIYNYENNFEKIKIIKFNTKIFNIENNKDSLLINAYNYYNLTLKFVNKKIIWDKISYNYYLIFENLKDELNINLKELFNFYINEDIIDKTILFNYIFKINYNIIKFTESPKLLSNSLDIFGIDKFFIELKFKFNWIDLVISSNKINIFLEPLLDYYIKNNHFYEINYLQFLIILNKIKDIYLFKLFIKYIFQRSEIPSEFKKIKYININEYKIVSSRYLCYEKTLHNKIFSNNSIKNEKKEFEIFNIPFKMNGYISNNHKLFQILDNCPDFIKISNFKYLVYYYFNKIKYFKYFNIIMYVLLIVSMTINLVNKNLIMLFFYLLCIIYFIFYEITQLCYDYKSYFKLLINWFDIFLIIYNIIIFIYIYLGLFTSINLIIMPLYYFNGYKLINFLKSIDLIRKEIRLFINVIKNTYSFIFFIVIILIYFTNLNFLFNFNNFKKFNLSFFNVYGQMLGNFDDNFNEYRFYDFFELLINTYSFNIILLNLFISVISKIFDNYNENLELYDIQEKISLLKEFSSFYFILDYFNKIIFKSNKKEKYYFFIFEKKREEIDLIEINKKLIDLESNIIKDINSKIESKIDKIKIKEDDIKSEVKDIKTSLNSIESDIKKIWEKLNN